MANSGRRFSHRFDCDILKKILLVGVPGGIENGLFQVGKIAILSLIATFGTTAIAANAVTQNLAGIQMIPGSAIQLAVVTIIARCVGAKEYEQAKYFNKKLILFAHAAVAAVSVILWLSLPLVLPLYHLSGASTALAVRMFGWHTAGALLLWPSSFILAASLRASGDVAFPMLWSVVSMWVFRFGGAWLFAVGFGTGAVGAWIAMSMLDWGFRTILYWRRWSRGAWREKGLA